MNKPKSRIENIVIQEMNAELLIYDLKDNKAFCLNETSAIIYQLCDGKRTVADINKALSKKLNQSVNDELIWLALDGLKKENLLENSDIEIDFNGLNRRQIIRKVGLASLIALPMISSLVAPSAANAGSGLLALCVSCTLDSECASGSCNGLGNRCSPPGNDAGIPPGPRRGICQTDSTLCLSSSCMIGCCSGLTSFSGGSCFCDPVP